MFLAKVNIFLKFDIVWGKGSVTCYDKVFSFLSTVGPLLRRLCFLARLLFFGHMLLFLKITLSCFWKEVDPICLPNLGFWGQASAADQDFEK